jgi:multidrug resistance protein
MSNRIDLSHRWRVLTGITIVQLFSVMAGTVVTTAAPRIAVDLQGFSLYGLIFAGYTLAAAVATPIVGGLSDVMGRRPFYLGGLALFVLGSVLCALAGNMPIFVAGRILSGFGGGPLIFLVSTTVGDLFPPRQRSRWISLNMAVFGIGSIVGPLVGGLVTDTVGWRWLFWASLPLAAVGLVLLGPVLPRFARPPNLTLDLGGIGLLTLGVVGVLAALTKVSVDFDWTSPVTIASLAMGLIALAALIRREARLPNPLIPMTLFANRTFVLALTANFLMAIIFFGSLVYVPLYLEAGAGRSAAETGRLLAPFLLFYAIGGVTCGQLMARTGRHKALGALGIAIAAAGTVLLAAGIDPGNGALFALAISCLGIGCSISFGVLILLVQNAFAYRLLGTANSIRILGINLAQAIGIPALLLVTLGVLHNTLTADLPADQVALTTAVFLRDPQAAAAVNSGHSALSAVSTEALRLGLTNGIRVVFLVMAGICAGAFLISLFLPATALAETFDEDNPGRSRADMTAPA